MTNNSGGELSDRRGMMERGSGEREGGLDPTVWDRGQSSNDYPQETRATEGNPTKNDPVNSTLGWSASLKKR